MAGLRAEIQGLDELTAALSGLVDGMLDGATEGAEATAEMVADEWRDDVPVDTGELRDSIGHDEEGAFAEAEHGPFVEFGTSTQDAQPSGTLAAEAGRRDMPDIVGDAVKRRLP